MVPLINKSISWLTEHRFPEDRQGLLTDHLTGHVEARRGRERVISDKMFRYDTEDLDGQLRYLLRGARGVDSQYQPITVIICRGLLCVCCRL
jgi:hypothetical protein